MLPWDQKLVVLVHVKHSQPATFLTATSGGIGELVSDRRHPRPISLQVVPLPSVDWNEVAISTRIDANNHVRQWYNTINRLEVVHRASIMEPANLDHIIKQYISGKSFINCPWH